MSGQDNAAELRLGKNQIGYGGPDVRFMDGRNKKKGPAIKPNVLNSALKNAPIKDTAILQNIQNKVIVKQGEQRDKEIEERNKEEAVCDLCQRPWPIFVVETDDMIKRLPERFLSPLLKSLKKDFNNKRQLSLIHISEPTRPY